MTQQSTDPVNVVNREVTEVWNNGTLESIDELVADGFVYQNPMLSEEVEGPDDYRELVKTFRGAMSDFHMDVEEMISEGDTVATRFSTTGVQNERLQDIEPTGNEIDVTGMLFDRVEDGKLVERRVNDDAFGLLRQLEVVDQKRF